MADFLVAAPYKTRDIIENDHQKMYKNLQLQLVQQESNASYELM